MINLLKVIVLSLFVVLVVVIVITGIRKNVIQEVHNGPGPQVPDIEISEPYDAVETDLEDPVITEDVQVATTTSGADPYPVTDCTADAQICPDGSAVGRTGPNCEFATCPTQTITVSKRCTASQKQAEFCTMEYAPVCGLVEVQCVTTPCDPVPQTFGNACGACAQGNVVSYTAGECST